MRHRKAGRKFGMDNTARKAMYRNMVTSLMLHGQIRTTEARAKELRRYADKVITMGKRAPSADQISSLKGDEAKDARAQRVHAIRRAKRWVNNDEAIAKVFGEYADRFANRPGGYTRVLKLGRRPGDNAQMAIIALVESLEAKPAEQAVAADQEATEVAKTEAAEE